MWYMSTTELTSILTAGYEKVGRMCFGHDSYPSKSHLQAEANISKHEKAVISKQKAETQ